MNKNTSLQVIGIAGGSGSGKSTFAKLLSEELYPLKTNILSTDCFFRFPLPQLVSPVSGKTYDDWNSPSSIDLEKLTDSVQKCLSASEEGTTVILEGLSILYFPELLELMDLKIFIDLDSDERMYRRIKRNMTMWNTPMEEIAEYYLEAAKYGEEKFFLPTKQKADLIINGRTDFSLSLSVVAAWIRTQLKQKKINI